MHTNHSVDAFADFDGMRGENIFLHLVNRRLAVDDLHGALGHDERFLGHPAGGDLHGEKLAGPPFASWVFQFHARLHRTRFGIHQWADVRQLRSGVIAGFLVHERDGLAGLQSFGACGRHFHQHPNA